MSAANPNDLSFRVATHADVEAIVALVHSAYRGESSRAGWTTEADLLDGTRTDADEVARLIGGAASAILLAEWNAQIIASAALECRQDTGYFGMFGVQPGLQSNGVGSAVLSEAERYAKTVWSCRQMEMTVITLRPELIAWYERRGYCRTGVFKPFPQDNPRYGLPRRPGLRLEVLRKTLASDPR